MPFFRKTNIKNFLINIEHISRIHKPHQNDNVLMYEVIVFKKDLSRISFFFFNEKDAWRKYIELSDQFELYERRKNRHPIIPG